VTGEVSPYRAEPFRMLAEAEGVEVVAWAGPGPDVPGLTVRRMSQAGAARLVASGRYRAAICGLGGRVALPATYLAARRAGVPFVLWASIWSHPRTPAHALSLLPTRALYRRADAVVTYGPHVSRHVERHRDRGAVFEAPQAVSAVEFGAPVATADAAAWRERAGVAPGAPLALFAGRLVPEKGVRVLLDAWRRSGLAADGGALAVAGDGPLRGEVEGAGGGVRALGPVARERLSALYAAADVLVLPSIRTATFTEPWGFVVNEAMHQGTPAITTDAVGAAAGGLVRDGRNGLVVPERDADALAARLRLLAANPQLRASLGEAARADVAAYSHEAWVEGMSAALAAVGASRRRDRARPGAEPARPGAEDAG
jgi:glycosyltransferase involved in cell wall biosynthesis